MTTHSMSATHRTDLQRMLLDVGHGSVSAFAALYDELAPLVHAVAMAALPDPAVAEQATESTFLTVWRRAAHYRPAEQDAAQWVLEVAVRVTAKYRSRLQLSD